MIKFIQRLFRWKEPWYKGGVKFRCTQCGGCCTGPSGEVGISRNDARKIAGLLHLSLPGFLEKYTHYPPDSDQLILIKKGEDCGEEYLPDESVYDCIFLSAPDVFGRRGCRIHQAKPIQCRAWPFWPETMASEEDWNQAGNFCPGINRGDTLLPARYIDKHLRAMNKLQQRRGEISAGWRENG